MKKPQSNYAFIDGTNLHRSTIGMGWLLDTKKFRRYLSEKHGVVKAYYFIGYVDTNHRLYETLKTRGYELVFKETYIGIDGNLKGNVDSELVLNAMVEYDNYEKAIIVTSDGDFTCLADYLRTKEKLQIVVACSKGGCSHLLEKAIGPEYICYIDELRKKLEYHKY